MHTPTWTVFIPIDIFKVTAISIFKTLSGSHHHVSKNILFGDTQSESILALYEVMGGGIICTLVNFSLAFKGRKIRRTTSDSTVLRAGFEKRSSCVVAAAGPRIQAIHVRTCC